MDKTFIIWTILLCPFCSAKVSALNPSHSVFRSRNLLESRAETQNRNPAMAAVRRGEKS